MYQPFPITIRSVQKKVVDGSIARTVLDVFHALGMHIAVVSCSLLGAYSPSKRDLQVRASFLTEEAGSRGAQFTSLFLHVFPMPSLYERWCTLATLRSVQCSPRQ